MLIVIVFLNALTLQAGILDAAPKFNQICHLNLLTLMVELQVWGLAINLAKEHVEKRLPEVVTTVAKWLSQADCYEAAGELYEDINAMKDVILYPVCPNQQISRFRSQYAIELNLRMQSGKHLLKTSESWVWDDKRHQFRLGMKRLENL